jgi:dolichol-phosphate mannosyltransferase
MSRGREVLQAARFLAVGATGTAVNMVVFIACHEAGLSSTVSGIAAFLIACQHNLLLHRRVTFRCDTDAVRWRAARYVTLSAVTLGVNLAVLALIERAGAPAALAQLAGIAAATPLNYAGSRAWVFPAGQSRSNTAQIAPIHP